MNSIKSVCLLFIATLPAAAQFTETAPGLPEKLFPCVAVGDYDGDGDLDVLVAANGKHDVPFTTIYKNTGGVFSDSGIVLLGLSRATAAWGDFDGDGDLDLAMTGVENNGAFTGPARTRIYRNNGGTFSLVPGTFLGVFAGSVAWGDYDGDGDLDLLVNGTTLTSAEGVPVTRLYRNDGGAFTSVAHPFPNCLQGAASWGDYDNDGDLDVMVIGYEPLTQLRRSILYRNDAGTFVDTGDTFHNVYLGAVKWMDYDNDGDLDLLLTGNTADVGDVLRIYRNNNVTANTAPSAPTNLAVNILGTSVDVSWSAGSDTQTPAAGLTYNWRVGTAPGASNIVAPQSSNAGYRRLAAMGNVQSRLGASVRGLVPGTTYFWSVQSVDSAFAGSAFAAEGSFTALADPPQNFTLAREAGGFRTVWRGTPGSTYRVEISEDLAHWTPVATPTAASGTGLFEFLDVPPVETKKRFYRAARP